MDIKKLKYMTKLAMKHAKYLSKSEKFFDAKWEAIENNKDKKAARYGRKAYKYKNKAYYIKQVYDLEIKIQGSINNINTEWEEL